MLLIWDNVSQTDEYSLVMCMSSLGSARNDIVFILQNVYDTLFFIVDLHAVCPKFLILTRLMKLPVMPFIILFLFFELQVWGHITRYFGRYYNGKYNGYWTSQFSFYLCCLWTWVVTQCVDLILDHLLFLGPM